MRYFLSIFLIAAFGVISFSSDAQARQDETIIDLIDKGPTFLQATGWKKSKVTGKWVSHHNFIGEGFEKKSEVPHFEWLRWVSFESKGEKMFVLYYRHKYSDKGALLGTEIDAISYIVMDAAEYSSILTALERNQKVHIDARHYTEIRQSNQDDIATILTMRGTQVPPRDLKAKGIFVDCQVIKGQQIVRFDPTGQVEDGTQEYFETDMASFKAAMIPVTAIEAARAQDLHHIKNWQNSDTLYGKECQKHDPSLTDNGFYWAHMSNFELKGKKMYCLFWKVLSGGHERVSYMIMNDRQYHVLKNMILSTDGRNYTVEAEQSGSIEKGDFEKNFIRVYEWDAQRKKNTYTLQLNKSKKIRFFWEYYNHAINFTNNSPDSYYECPVQLFSKLLTLP